MPKFSLQTFKWVYLTIGLWIVMLHHYELSNVDPSHWATNQLSQWSPFWICVKAECIHSVNPGMKSSRLLGSLLQSNCEHASFSAVNISVILHSLWETAGRWVAQHPLCAEHLKNMQSNSRRHSEYASSLTDVMQSRVKTVFQQRLYGL